MFFKIKVLQHCEFSLKSYKIILKLLVFYLSKVLSCISKLYIKLISTKLLVTKVAIYIEPMAFN